MRNPIRQDARFAAARPGDNHDGAINGAYGLKLSGIQVVEKGHRDKDVLIRTSEGEESSTCRAAAHDLSVDRGQSRFMERYQKYRRPARCAGLNRRIDVPLHEQGAFEPQKKFFRLDSGRVTHETIVAADHPMTRNDNRQGIGAVRPTDGLIRSGLANPA